MSAQIFARCALVTLGVLASSCGELTASWKLTDFRILGIRAYSRAEPTRNAPRRGEIANLELVTADVRERPVRAAWLIVGSISSMLPGGTGTPGTMNPLNNLNVCDSDAQRIDLPGLSLRCGPMTDFVVPAMGASDGRGRESVTVFGMACASGRIRIVTSGNGSSGAIPFECSSASGEHKGWPFQYQLLVGTAAGGSANDNLLPQMVAVRAGPAAGPLTEISMTEPATIARCADQSSRTMCPKLRIEVEFSEGSRERYTERDPTTMAQVPRQERMLTGYVVSAGRLDGAFRSDNESEPVTTMRNDWLPPATPGDTRLIVYATDGRGGFVHREVMLRTQ
ncbi:MAG: hypothetical protein Q8Q09_24475 [Deltaproteobacteria bacterium]|nr:hypothetical protein [Deltaproteobacteria bacterium]